jgi:inosine-uridine nucleoside N-ribohydrolase
VDDDPSVTRALLMGLDVTEQARLLPDDLAAMKAGGTATVGAVASAVASVTAGPPGGEIARFLDDALRWYFEFHARYDGFCGAFVHDPFVVAAALDPSLVTTEVYAVDVDAAGGVADGLTIADRRGIWGRQPNADVAVRADAPTFLARLVERVGGLAAVR